MAWDTEGTRAGDHATCAPCGNTYHADDPMWAEDRTAGPGARDPICENCRADEKEADTDEDHQHDTAAELEAFGPAIP